MATIGRNDGTRKSSPRTLTITSNHAEISMKEGVAPTLTETERWLGILKTGSACGSTSAVMVPTVTVMVALFHLL